jgi:hypothetical protein
LEYVVKQGDVSLEVEITKDGTVVSFEGGDGVWEIFAKDADEGEPRLGSFEVVNGVAGKAKSVLRIEVFEVFDLGGLGSLMDLMGGRRRPPTFLDGLKAALGFGGESEPDPLGDLDILFGSGYSGLGGMLGGLLEELGTAENYEWIVAKLEGLEVADWQIKSAEELFGSGLEWIQSLADKGEAMCGVCGGHMKELTSFGFEDMEAVVAMIDRIHALKTRQSEAAEASPATPPEPAPAPEAPEADQGAIPAS